MRPDLRPCDFDPDLLRRQLHPARSQDSVARSFSRQSAVRVWKMCAIIRLFKQIDALRSVGFGVPDQLNRREGETGSSCVKESVSVRGSWWASPIASSRCSARSSKSPREPEPGSRGDRALRPGRRRLGGRAGDYVQKVAQDAGDFRGRDLQEPLADRQRSVAAVQGSQPDREPAVDGAFGACKS